MCYGSFLFLRNFRNSLTFSTKKFVSELKIVIPKYCYPNLILVIIVKQWQKSPSTVWKDIFTACFWSYLRKFRQTETSKIKFVSFIFVFNILLKTFFREINSHSKICPKWAFSVVVISSVTTLTETKILFWSRWAAVKVLGYNRYWIKRLDSIAFCR